MIKSTSITLAGALFAVSAAVAAGQSLKSASSTTDLDQWEKEAMYEPCMNGAVSASGLYPSQVAEDKSFATLGFIAGRTPLP